MPENRLRQQLSFLHAVDGLKRVDRRTLLTDGSRPENSAEHSWHVALMALVLAEHAPPGLDLARVVRMLLVHDVVEVEAGDTFCYDPQASSDQEEREQRAAERLFGLLPADQAGELETLWNEFEARTTPESRYANALDRFQPLLHNMANQGGSWRQHGVRKDQVVARVGCIVEGSPTLWSHAERLIEEAVERGWLDVEDGASPSPPPTPP